MSHEHDVTVVRLNGITKHPNADSLSITEVLGYPVIFRTGEYGEGDLAVYVPVDSVVPADDPRWTFLEGHRRIRAKKLRGVFSMGLLTPTDPSFAEGDVVNDQLGITHYEPAEHSSSVLHGPDPGSEPDPGHMPAYTDIESWRRYRAAFDPAEEVIATEKIHGTNARYTFADGRFWAGSRKNIKREDPASTWWQALTHDLKDAVAALEGYAVYGEIYGRVQDLRYGIPSGVRFVAFDILDISTRRYLDYDAAAAMFERLGIPHVPELYRGPFGELTPSLANGRTVLGSGVCVREGFVVRPVKERWDERLGRVILKLAGEDYHLRKAA
jgi:RNA ligase (TIGR02306 family)